MAEYLDITLNELEKFVSDAIASIENGEIDGVLPQYIKDDTDSNFIPVTDDVNFHITLSIFLFEWAKLVKIEIECNFIYMRL